MPHPTDYSNLRDKGKRAPRRGATPSLAPKASAPTGRLVITSLTGSNVGGDQSTHWLPKPTDDLQQWSCPDPGCDFQAIYVEDDKEWRHTP